MGRTDHEAGAGKMGGGSSRIRQLAGVGPEGSDEPSATTPQRPRRNYSARCRRPLRDCPQHSTHGLGATYDAKTRGWNHAQPVAEKSLAPSQAGQNVALSSIVKTLVLFRPSRPAWVASRLHRLNVAVR